MGRAAKLEANRLAIGMHVAVRVVAAINSTGAGEAPSRFSESLNLTTGRGLKTVCDIARVERGKSGCCRDRALDSRQRSRYSPSNRIQPILRG